MLVGLSADWPDASNIKIIVNCESVQVNYSLNRLNKIAVSRWKHNFVLDCNNH